MKGKPLKSIGVLGGMGATVSADFYVDLVRRAQRDYGATEDSDFPAMLIYNLPAVGFDETGFTDVELMKRQLIDSVRLLEKGGSDFIVIPCNTVHLLADDMQAALGIPLLSIVDVVAKKLTREGRKTVGLVSSKSTRDTGLYEQALRKNGITTLSVTDEEQQELNAIIGSVMKGTHAKEEEATLAKIMRRLVTDGAEAVVLGCTELPLAVGTTQLNVPLYSSNALLAEAALEKAYGIEK